MPKAILVFDLPEEQDDFRLASNAGKWHSLAFDHAMFLRNKLKYGHEFKSADEALENVIKNFYDEMEYSGISLDDMS